MMFQRKYIFGFVALTGLSAALAKAEREHGGRLAPLAVQVSFGSIGTGIDNKAFDTLIELTTVELKEGRLSLLKNTLTGREGERTLCIQFNQFQDAYAFQNKVVREFAHDGIGAQHTKVERILSCSPIQSSPQI